MDTAFYNRTGFTSAFLYSEVNFYPQKAKRTGLIRVHPLVIARYGRDRLQAGDECLLIVIEQFDSSRRQLLTDLLASYEFVPGTIFHAGYGSLYEQRELVNGQLVPNAGSYLTVRRGLFFKASYLYRF